MNTEIVKRRFKEDVYVCNLSDELRNIAKNELREEETTRAQALTSMRNWIQNEPSIEYCRCDANFLLRFLRVKKFSLPLAQEMLLNYLTMRALFPEWYTRLDVHDAVIDELASKGFIYPLQERDSLGRKVLLCVPRVADTTRVTSADIMRVLLMTIETLLEDEENQIRGFVYIVDCKDLGFDYISIWTPTTLQRAVRNARKGLPMRHKGVNIVNLGYIMSAFFELAKSFCSDKVQKRTSFQYDDTDLSTIVPKEILPKEYGGTIPVKHMIDSWRKELLRCRERILMLDEMKVDEEWKESKTAVDLGGVLGIEGSFRKLEID